ncbi:hypothetical protein WN982_26555 [Paraburkholderia sp. IMGN_8]|uniref:hypothetical protein n=1 Tax=Paraburkholderia sp. IMGN_8 TaxID=3136564 RepID=UPI003101B293
MLTSQEYQIISSLDLPVGFNEPSEHVKVLNRTNWPWTYVFRPALVRKWSPEALMEIFCNSGMTAWSGMREYGALIP